MAVAGNLPPSFARSVGHSDVGLAPTTDLNCLYVSERKRGQAVAETAFCMPDPNDRADFLSIGLLIACTRSQHAASSSTPSFGARVQIPQCAIRPSLLSSPPFPNLIGEARVDENRRTVMHSIGGPKCFSIELRQLWFSSTRKSMS